MGNVDKTLQEIKQDNLRIAKDSELWEDAVNWTRDKIPEEEKERVRDLHEDDPDEWWAPFHFFGGMKFRNALRGAGFGERELGVSNLDNIYIEIIEEAVGV